MNNNSKLSKLLRFAITFLVVSLAVFLGLMLWDNYMNSAWTRDGRVRADVVMVAPDVGGLVSRVAVVDNQEVHKGDLLYKSMRSGFIMLCMKHRRLP
jgi:multidrug resistance efflux pump